MKAARIQSSLKDLHKDIGNCERQLYRVLDENDVHLEPARSRSFAKNSNVKLGYRQPTLSHLSKSETKQTKENMKMRRPRTPNKGLDDEDRNIIRKEVIGNRHSPTRVEVVIRTKPLKRRSRSVQASRNPTKDYSGNNRSFNLTDSVSHSKNASWGHILQQQSSSTCHVKSNVQPRRKTCSALRYSSSDCEHPSEDLEKWVQSIPRGQVKSSPKISCEAVNGNLRFPDIDDCPYSSLNPLRTLNFLVKELRGKVHEDYDENIQRIIHDMEKALGSIPANASHVSPPTKLSAMQQNTPTISTKKTSLSRADQETHIKAKAHLQCQNQVSHQSKKIQLDSSPNLVDCLLSTVSHLTKITGLSKEAEESNPVGLKKQQYQSKTTFMNFAPEGPQAQLELGCKQLEETCWQMKESYENLKQEKNQILSDFKQKTQQLETMTGKCQQLTLYAADIRQEMLRHQQASEIIRQEHEILKQKLISQQREFQDSNSHLKKRLEETMLENERLCTELQLCRLEKDKIYILMSNKDLEVAKLKKEIVDINTLVAEQLTNIYTIPGKKCSVNELGKMMQAVSRLHDTAESPNSQQTRENLKNQIGDGEGSRSHPICSSPTSSVHSSLYSSWQLMSDITATDLKAQEHKEEGRGEEKMFTLPRESVFNKDKDSGINSATPIDVLARESTSKIDDAASAKKRGDGATELKAGLHEMFQLLKKQTSEAVNITLPSPSRACDKVQETLGMSQWTELSASESTVLFHSSDESESEERS